MYYFWLSKPVCNNLDTGYKLKYQIIRKVFKNTFGINF